MNISNKRKTEGFTIIEVVLVLAIAGLIFLIVFLALPALQRSQRDTQRKNDLSRMMSQLTQYQSNHQGQIPANQSAWQGSASSFVESYLTNNGASFSDPQKNAAYTVTQQSSYVSSTLPSVGNIYVYPGYNCQSGTPTSTGNARDVAALIGLEQGGNLCQNN